MFGLGLGYIESGILILIALMVLLSTYNLFRIRRVLDRWQERELTKPSSLPERRYP